MSPWIFVVILLIVFWVVHVQLLNEKRREIAEELNALKASKKSLESTLISRGRRLDVLFSAVNEVVMRVDHTGRIMAANNLAAQLFTMGDRSSLPRAMMLFYRDPDWQDAFSEGLKRLPDATALPDIHVAGRVLAPRLAPLGKKQALLLCMDVTEKRRLEAQRKSLFANLMHDLKTPLTSILGYARSIEDFGDDEQARKQAASVIANESLRANKFLDALLTVEHIENFNPDVSVTSDFQQVLESILHEFASQLQEKRVNIEFSGDECAGEVNIAESNLHRILDNPIENAIRYTPEGSKIFLVGSQSEKSYQLNIIDQGDGVSEKELPRLTERFYRGDMARANSSDTGHGLGLAIVKELLEKHGGEMEISNHDQYGLDVLIRLPVSSKVF